MEVFNNLCQATQRILGSCFRSTLNRFASADTIVPNPSNPQSFNRYSYVRNNPVNRIDPSGHRDCGAMDNEFCGINTPTQNTPSTQSNHPGLPVPPDEVDTLGRLNDPEFRTPLNPLPNPTAGRGFDAVNHTGVDYGRNAGTPIYASTTGIVVISDTCSLQPSCIGQFGNQTAPANGGYGNLVIVEYGYDSLPQSVIDAYGLTLGQSLYVLTAHMVESSDYWIGDVVQSGDIIGRVGNTGHSTGNHLHVEIRTGRSMQLWDSSLCATNCRDNDAGNQTPWETWRDDLDPVDPEIVWP